jgi:hypothetical protein
MTAAGLALIAGGLATLISFRSFLFGGGERRSRRRQAVIEAPRSRPALSSAPEVAAVAEAFVDGSVVEVEERLAVEDGPARSRRGRRGRRRALVSASGGRSTAYAVPLSSDEDEQGGLASLGFAAEDDDAEFDVPEAENEPVTEPPVTRRRRSRRSRPERGEEILFDPPSRHGEENADRFHAFEPVEPSRRGRATHADDGDIRAEVDEPVTARPSRSDHYGDRVEGWVRPEYHEQSDEPRPGEYWTPIPVDLNPDPEPSAKGYGWPLPVERLPSVPDYEPATGFDMKPVPAEPTEVVPVWPMNEDRRIRLPRTWSARNDKAEKPAPAERRRPRPRPRPEISEITEPPANPSTMYVSRHAADPPPR